MKKLFLLLAVMAFVGALNAGAKKITINVVPETAKIYIDGALVGTGSYQVNFKGTDFYVVKVEDDGYLTRTYRLLKSNPKNTVLFQLPVDDAKLATTGSEDGMDLANRWFDVTCRKGLTEDQIWKRLMSVCTSYYDNIEVRDKSAGWIKTSWKLTRFKFQTVRTRVEVRMSFVDDDVVSYRVRLTVQINNDNDCRGENCFKPYDRVPRNLESLVQELQTSVGGGE